MNDGSCLKNLQVIVETSVSDHAKLASIRTGSAVAVKGRLVESEGKGQRWEIEGEDDRTDWAGGRVVSASEEATQP